MEIIKVALSSLKANKLRSALTIVGIAVGIFSIITVTTVVTMLQESIEKGVSSLGKNTFQIQKFPIQVGGNRSERAKYRNRKDITIEEYEKLKEKLNGDALAVAAEQWGYGKIVEYGNKETNPNVQVSGVTLGAFPNNNWVAGKGRLFSEQELQRYENVVVLGSDVVKKLFSFIDPIGKYVKIDGHKLRVIGILEEQGSSFGQSQDNFAVIPITTFQSFYGKRRRSINITVSSHNKEDYNDLIEKARGYFRTIRKVPAGEDDDFGIFSNESIMSQINNITNGVRIGAIAIGLIALLAAGIGIMNIMLVSVTERTKEIGIRKAIGARRNNILIQFLSEAVILSLIGGVIGIVLGLLVGNLAGSFLNAAAAIPINWVIIGVLLCVVVGVGFGTYPAYKAANLDPIEALRHE
jgi:putative ABC transport system permease protein